LISRNPDSYRDAKVTKTQRKSLFQIFAPFAPLPLCVKTKSAPIVSRGERGGAATRRVSFDFTQSR
jgi:hypothetical protein